jgi:hypothetical protein
MKNVSDGCFYHVCFKIEPEVLRAANTQTQYNLLGKIVKGQALYEAEMAEGERVDAAQASILKDVKCALHAIHSMPKLSELMASDGWELRILLCKTEKEAVNA